MTDGPVYLITAAGRGIGEACARQLAADGARLVLLSPSGSAVALAEELGAAGMTGSITQSSDLAQMVQLAIDTYGRIDGLVINTGILSSSRRKDGSARATGPAFNPFDDTELTHIGDDEWREGFDMMFLSVTRLLQLALPEMRAKKQGSVVVISTFSAPEPRLAYPVASCMRAGVGALLKLYSDRYGREHIRFNAVMPGFIENWDQTDEVIDAIPLARLGHLKEVADTVQFLLSEKSGYITGQSLLVDGGINRNV